MSELRDDRGAVATVFAILLAGGVLLGFLALVIDLGQIAVEREELQSGADAAALAVARSCAAAGCASAEAVVSLAQRYADGNAGDGRSRVTAVCGRLPGGTFDCPSGGCLAEAPPAPIPFVEVHLGTELDDGRFVLPPVFAQTLAGNADDQGTDVTACARATWKPPAELSLVALTLADCAVAEAVASGFADPSGPSPGDERSVELVPGHAGCPSIPPGPWLRAGPAGWLDGDGSCEVTAVSRAGVPGTADPAAPPGCLARLRQARDGREIVYLPVYDMLSAGLPDRIYHVVALAPFIVTGWRLGPGANDVATSWLTSPPPPSNPPSTAPSTTVRPSAASVRPAGAVPAGVLVDPCGGSQRCVTGVFVGPAVPVSDVAAGDATTGSALVTLIG